MLCTSSGQGIIAFAQPVCDGCGYRVLGRCAGPTGGSLLPPTKNSIGCLDAQRQVDAIENLSRRLLPKPNTPLPVPRLRGFIPQMLPGAPQGCRLLSKRLYAVALSTLLDNAGHVRFRSGAKLRRQLGLPDAAELLLLGTVDDERLERFWEESEVRQSWARLRGLGFRVATTLTCSVWDNDPRFDQIYNQERNLLSYEILTGLGIPTIPFLFCAAPEDYEAAAEWLRKRPAVRSIAQLAQFYTGNKEFRAFLDRAERLATIVGRPLRHVIVGVATKEKIDEAKARLGRVTIITSVPVFKAIKAGQMAMDDLTYEAAPLVPRHVLVPRNIEKYTSCCS